MDINQQKTAQWIAASVIAVFISFALDIMEYRYGRFRGENFWFITVIGISCIAYWVISLIRFALNDTASTSDAKNDYEPRRNNTDKNVLTFKNNDTAFQYACANMDNTLHSGVVIPAIVLDFKKLGMSESVPRNSEGIQVLALKVAASDGGFVVVSQTPNSDDVDIHPGDLVSWIPVTYSDERVENATDMRFGWVGYIAAKLKPAYDIIESGWLTEEVFLDLEKGIKGNAVTNRNPEPSPKNGETETTAEWLASLPPGTKLKIFVPGDPGYKEPK